MTNITQNSLTFNFPQTHYPTPTTYLTSHSFQVQYALSSFIILLPFTIYHSCITAHLLLVLVASFLYTNATSSTKFIGTVDFLAIAL